MTDDIQYPNTFLIQEMYNNRKVMQILDWMLEMPTLLSHFNAGKDMFDQMTREQLQEVLQYIEQKDDFYSRQYTKNIQS